MWYQVPETKPAPAEKPKPIFPWEREPDRPAATRVFAEDLPPAPTQSQEAIQAPAPTHPFPTVHYQEGDQGAVSHATSPPRASSPQTAEEQWQSFQQNNTNAWDSVPGIDTYVRAIMGQQQVRREKPQALPLGSQVQEILSPSAERKNRRESLILTDFPTAVERPSLPVTPAPVRRPTFWGEERNDAGELPTAEGVPDQAEWVCPNCGFSSVSEEDFRSNKREFELASAVASRAPASLSIAITTSAQSTPEPEVMVEPLSVEPEPPVAMPTATAINPPASEAQYRAGFSVRGAPLASLTDPSLYLHPPSPSVDISEPSSPASSVEPSFASAASATS